MRKEIQKFVDEIKSVIIDVVDLRLIVFAFIVIGGVGFAIGWNTDNKAFIVLGLVFTYGGFFYDTFVLLPKYHEYRGMLRGINEYTRLKVDYFNKYHEKHGKQTDSIS